MVPSQDSILPVRVRMMRPIVAYYACEESPVSAATKQVRVKVYRGVQIQFWESGSRWNAFAPGQSRSQEGYSNPEHALEIAEKFIDKSF